GEGDARLREEGEQADVRETVGGSAAESGPDGAVRETAREPVEGRGPAPERPRQDRRGGPRLRRRGAAPAVVERDPSLHTRAVVGRRTGLGENQHRVRQRFEGVSGREACVVEENDDGGRLPTERNQALGELLAGVVRA